MANQAPIPGPALPPAARLDSTQQRALMMMLAGYDVFLTGRAGCGKSTVLREFRRITRRATAYLAPTGIAALNIVGQTLHSFLRLPVGIQSLDDIPREDPELEAALRETATIVVDEISMVRSDAFNALDKVLRFFSPTFLQQTPFGGRQVVAIGDFAQLPPVVKGGREYNLLREFHGGVFAFETASWADASFLSIELGSVYRQNEENFLDILGAIRNGGPARSGASLEDSIDSFNKRAELSCPLAGDEITLCTTNRRASEINRRRANQLDTAECIFEGEVSGHFEMDDLPVAQTLALREGARVMIVANGVESCGGYAYVNGDTGRVVELRPDDPAARVLLDDGRDVWVTPATWPQLAYSVRRGATLMPELARRIVGTYTQLPVRLGYAATIHKTQGLTLPQVHLELGSRGPFAHGQLYVALSRCKTLAGISLDRPLRASDVIVDRRVREFMAGHSSEASLPSPAIA